MSPTPMDFDRLGAVLELVEDVGPVRAASPVVAALLTRVVTNSASAEVYRTAASDVVPVLPARVARLERFAQAFGCPIDDALNTAYGDALTQLLDMEVARP
ncbi:hypothetical protein [Gordonia sp. UBA7860]|nr:hypothetical protein [Gordonia sp. UBA7860]